MVVWGVPENFYDTYARTVSGMDAARATAAARSVVGEGPTTWVVVGDRAVGRLEVRNSSDRTLLAAEIELPVGAGLEIISDPMTCMSRAFENDSSSSGFGAGPRRGRAATRRPTCRDSG